MTTYGRLTVIESSIKEGRRYKAKCVCECGTELLVDETHLRSGHTKSCGCLQRDLVANRQTKHGRYYEPEYRAWTNMKKRCAEPRFSKWYKDINVCVEWLNSYDQFLSDVGRKPTPQHSLERIDAKGNYEPSNVCWASKATQSRNTKNHSTNKTGIRGVSWSKEKQKWRVAIYVNNKQKHIGYFDDIKLAKQARLDAETLYWAALHDKRAISDIAMEELK
jgi:hypothetical protein